MRKCNIGFIVCLLVFFGATTSYAVQVGIDTFSIASSTLNFTDMFSDGNPPPCGPAVGCTQPTFYGVNSTSPLTESGGLVQLDSSNGILSTNAGGGARINESVTVRGTKSQLYSGTAGAILMTGVFTLPIITGPLNEGYGIRFLDYYPGVNSHNQEVLELNVQWWTGNAGNPAGWYIRYIVQDFDGSDPTYGHGIKTIGADLVDPKLGSEICLAISRADGSDQFEAGYGYLNGGDCSGLTLTALGSATGFLYQEYVRPQFHAFDTVPEPATWLLMGVGFVGLVLVTRRRTNILH